MAIGDAILFVGCLAGFMAAFPALLLFLNLMFTKTTFAAAQRLHDGVRLPLVVGIVAAVAVGFPASVLVSWGSLFQLIGVLLWLFLLTWAFVGLAALARMLGGRLGLLADRSTSVMTESVVGVIVLTFALAFPLIGWLLLMPLGMAVGMGATLISRRQPIYDTPQHTLDPMAEAS